MMPNPIVLYVAGGSLLIGAAAGWKVRDWRCDAALANALEQAAEQRQEAQDAINLEAENYEEVRTETYGMGTAAEREVRVIYRTMEPIPADCAVPDDVVSLLQARVDHANASASSESGQ